ncbi:hypothetical protein RQP46_003177 [Phenoliferia psychrophenolica]
MAPIDSLANETLCKIMSMLKEPSLPLWDAGESFPPGSYDDLRCAALVCSRRRDPAQRALFDTLLIDDSKLVRNENYWNWLSDPCFAGLKHLTILWPEAFNDSAGSARILTMRLESLALWLSGRVPPGPAFIAALFAASSASLQTLHLKLENLGSEISVHTSFHLVGANLRTLILESASDMLEGNFNFVSACTTLEHLVLNWDVDDHFRNRYNYQPSLPFHIQAILDALPSTPTLRHLSLNFYEPDDLDRIVTLLNHPALEILAKLELPKMALRGGKDASLEPLRASELEDAVVQALLSMKETCDRRGIDCKSMGEYRMWEEEM